jgi:hypothetical protein
MQSSGKFQENKTPQAFTSTDPTPTPIIHNYNQAMNKFIPTQIPINTVFIVNPGNQGSPMTFFFTSHTVIHSFINGFTGQCWALALLQFSGF